MQKTVGVICDTFMSRGYLFHQAENTYIEALLSSGGVTPLLIPSTATPIDSSALVKTLDGFLIPGAYSNVQRHHYGESPAPEGENEDILRDAASLPLIRDIVSAKKPFLAICRGCQEVNVALGGTLYPKLHEVDGRFDHRENSDDPIDQQYGLAHSVSLNETGLLHRITGESEFMVNSLHGQGIRDVADGLKIEAVADDETIEAVSAYSDGGQFGLAVQWHPEWHLESHEPNQAIFRSFMAAL